MFEHTLVMIKPDAVKKNVIGKVIARFEEENLRIIGMKMVHLATHEAERFYAIHRERPFYRDLVKFMTEGPIIVLGLEGKDAVKRVRTLMGATDPAKADAGTLRKLFGTNVERNATHGSDSVENAAVELAFHFPGCDLF